MDVPAVRVFQVLGVGLIMYAILVALGLLVPQIYRCKPEDKGIYSFMTIFGNAGFMGIPVAKALLGSEAGFYGAILNIPFNILAYTVGIAFLSSNGKREPINWRLLLNVPLIVSAASVVLLCLHVHLGGPLGRAVGMLGDMILPGSMVIIGASLGRQKLKDVFGDPKVYLFAPMRLVAVPLILWGIMHFIVKDSVFLGTMTLQAAMPVAAFATMLSIEYGGNVQMASKTVFVTTVLSVFTIPLVVGLLPL
jgi:predicted permease